MMSCHQWQFIFITNEKLLFFSFKTFFNLLNYKFSSPNRFISYIFFFLIQKNLIFTCLYPQTEAYIGVSVEDSETTNQFCGVRLLAIYTGMLRKRNTDNSWLLHVLAFTDVF